MIKDASSGSVKSVSTMAPWPTASIPCFVNFPDEHTKFRSCSGEFVPDKISDNFKGHASPAIELRDVQSGNTLPSLTTRTSFSVSRGQSSNCFRKASKSPFQFFRFKTIRFACTRSSTTPPRCGYGQVSSSPRRECFSGEVSVFGRGCPPIHLRSDSPALFHRTLAGVLYNVISRIGQDICSFVIQFDFRLLVRTFRIIGRQSITRWFAAFRLGGLNAVSPIDGLVRRPFFRPAT